MGWPRPLARSVVHERSARRGLRFPCPTVANTDGGRFRIGLKTGGRRLRRGALPSASSARARMIYRAVLRDV